MGVLAALGAPPGTIASTFRLSGLLLGGGGPRPRRRLRPPRLRVPTAFHVCASRPRSRTSSLPRLDAVPARPLHSPDPRRGLLLVLLASAMPARRAARLIPATRSGTRDVRLLVLSASAGAGHTRAAQALEARRGNPGRRGGALDVLAHVDRLYRRAYAAGYLSMVDKAPELWGALYRRSDRKPPHGPNASSSRVPPHRIRGFRDAVQCSGRTPSSRSLSFQRVFAPVRGEGGARFRFAHRHDGLRRPRVRGCSRAPTSPGSRRRSWARSSPSAACPRRASPRPASRSCRRSGRCATVPALRASLGIPHEKPAGVRDGRRLGRRLGCPTALPSRATRETSTSSRSPAGIPRSSGASGRSRRRPGGPCTRLRLRVEHPRAHGRRRTSPSRSPAASRPRSASPPRSRWSCVTRSPARRSATAISSSRPELVFLTYGLASLRYKLGALLPEPRAARPDEGGGPGCGAARGPLARSWTGCSGRPLRRRLRGVKPAAKDLAERPLPLVFPFPGRSVTVDQVALEERAARSANGPSRRRPSSPGSGSPSRCST